MRSRGGHFAVSTLTTEQTLIGSGVATASTALGIRRRMAKLGEDGIARGDGRRAGIVEKARKTLLAAAQQSCAGPPRSRAFERAKERSLAIVVVVAVAIGTISVAVLPGVRRLGRCVAGTS